MSVHFNATRATERLTSTEQIPPPAAEAPVGISGAPSSLCCLGGDANDSIFSRILTTITSFFTSVWTWVTGCFSSPAAVVAEQTAVVEAPPAVASPAVVSTEQATPRELYEALVAKGREALRGLMDRSQYPIQSDQCKLALAFHLDGQDITVLFRDLKLLTKPESLEKFRRGADTRLGADFESLSIREDSVLTLTLFIIETHKMPSEDVFIVRKGKAAVTPHQESVSSFNMETNIGNIHQIRSHITRMMGGSVEDGADQFRLLSFFLDDE